MKFRLIRRFLPMVLLVFLGGCGKDDDSPNVNGIPLVNVDVFVFANNPEFINLSVVGGWEYLSGGSRGLIVYRLTNDQFVAFDRHCPYQPEDDCARVEVDPNTLLIFDPCCDSEFSITDGNVLKGPAVFPLQQYGATWDGTVLHIFN